KGKSLSEDLELQSHWARYLCVLVSGYAEHSVRSLYTEYARDNASPAVAAYVQSQLKGFLNPKMENILTLSRLFKPEWAEELEGAVQEQIKASIDSVVNTRHHIAHGRSVGISFSIISQYYKDVLVLVRMIEEQCKK